MKKTFGNHPYCHQKKVALIICKYFAAKQDLLLKSFWLAKNNSALSQRLEGDRDSFVISHSVPTSHPPYAYRRFLLLLLLLFCRNGV
jgi:hypothetical protein